VGIIRKTFSIGLTGGLIGFRSKPEKVVRDIKLTARNAQQQTTLLKRQNSLIEQQSELIARNHEAGYKPAQPVPAPAPPEPTDRLDIALITRAAEIVVRDQVVSRRGLRDELGISYATLGHVLTLLEKQGYVSAEDDGGERVVLEAREPNI
jgi:DNA-binding transcriptional ArsR family regulator